MLTDDQVLTQLRGSMSGSVAGVAPSPGLLPQVRQAHHKAVRRQRLLAPAGLALLGLAAAGAVVLYPEAKEPAQERLATPSTGQLDGPRINVQGYDFRFPGGYRIDPTLLAMADKNGRLPVAWAYRGTSMKDGDRIHVTVMDRRSDSANVEQSAQAYRELGIDHERLDIAGYPAVLRSQPAVIVGGRVAVGASVSIQLELTKARDLTVSGTNIDKDVLLDMIEYALAPAAAP